MLTLIVLVLFHLAASTHPATQPSAAAVQGTPGTTTKFSSSLPATQPSAITKHGSSLYPPAIVRRVRNNVARDPWAAKLRDQAVATARPWKEMSDEQLESLMFGPGITRSWMVWSNGHCPACSKGVPMYTWVIDAMNKPWKVQCPHCKDYFPKNDYHAYYRSGLNEQGLFIPEKADRSLLFNAEHPDPADPKHLFGVDDGEGYVEGDKRWRFIGAYLIYGQWKQCVVNGIRILSTAYLLTGEQEYAHKAAVLLDRVADFYPMFDYKEQALVYERKLGSAGYVSVWHDACEETRSLVMAYDMIFDGMRRDAELVRFLSSRAKVHGLANPKAAFADIQRNIEDRILRDAVANVVKITSNYPRHDVAQAMIHAVLGGPENRAALDVVIGRMLKKATAVDGITGEKGLAGYASYDVHGLAAFLGEFSKADENFLPDLLKRYPSLRQTYRFHIDTHCLGMYYPTCGDGGSFAAAHTAYAGMSLPVIRDNPSAGDVWSCTNPSGYSLMWKFYECTKDAAYVQTMYRSNSNRVDGMPRDLYVEDPAAFQKAVREVIDREGAEIKLAGVNKQQWRVAILRSGQGRDARAMWLDYDTGGAHSHADGMNLGLYAKGLDLMPDFGYPPVQYGGWDSPRARWYTMSAAHNTVIVDGENSSNGGGETRLWADGEHVHAIRVVGGGMNQGRRYERTAVLVDVSPADSYVVDVFRVAGGARHTKFMHSHFGAVTTNGLTMAAAPDYGHGTQMRNVRMDANPKPGWQVDWQIEDRFKLLPKDTQVRLRYTDLTSDAQAGLAEGWITVGGYNDAEELWIPRVLVERTAKAGQPLESTFVGVIEPYEKQPLAKVIRRLPLQSEDGKTLSDAHVALEVTLADGRRQVIIARDPDASDAGSVMLPDAGIRTDAELSVATFAADGQLVSAGVCRGTKLSCKDVELAVPAGETFLEWSK